MSFSQSAQKRISVEAYYYYLRGNTVNYCIAAGHSSVRLKASLWIQPSPFCDWIGEI